MKYLVIIMIAVSMLLFSCENDAKKQRINAIYSQIEGYVKSKKEIQDMLVTWSEEDLNSINPNVSSLAGYPITYKQNFQMMINQHDEFIEQLKLKIEEIKNE